jgi:hypothetical protein
VDRSWEYINRSQTHECGKIGAEAAQFPEKEYINGIAVAVWANYARVDLNPICQNRLRSPIMDLGYGLRTQKLSIRKINSPSIFQIKCLQSSSSTASYGPTTHAAYSTYKLPALKIDRGRNIVFNFLCGTQYFI